MKKKKLMRWILKGVNVVEIEVVYENVQEFDVQYKFCFVLVFLGMGMQKFLYIYGSNGQRLIGSRYSNCIKIFKMVRVRNYELCLVELMQYLC